MKKTYINPSIVVVRLSMSKVIAASPDIPPTPNVDTSSACNPDEFSTKGITDVNVWDNEW